MPPYLYRYLNGQIVAEQTSRTPTSQRQQTLKHRHQKRQTITIQKTHIQKRCREAFRKDK